jgi:hypothetical protein
LDKICGRSHDLFSHIRVPKHRVPMDTSVEDKKRLMKEIWPERRM